MEIHGREMADKFCLKMPDFHVTFRDLLHAVNLHGTDSFTSPLPPTEDVLRIFSPCKIQRLRSGLNQRTWVPKASTLTVDHRNRTHVTYVTPLNKRHLFEWSGERRTLTEFSQKDLSSNGFCTHCTGKHLLLEILQKRK